MKKAQFNVVFSYNTVTVSNQGVDDRTVTATTCTIENASGDTLSEATVTPYIGIATNKFIARKAAFKKALWFVEFSREERTILWNLFRSKQIQPENGRTRLRDVISMVNKLPNLSKEDAEEISILLREYSTEVPKTAENVVESLQPTMKVAHAV